MPDILKVMRYHKVMKEPFTEKQGSTIDIYYLSCGKSIYSAVENDAKSYHNYHFT